MKQKLITLLALFLLATGVHSQSWSEIVKKVASDPGASDFYGNAVAISGDYAVVGASQEDEDQNGQSTLSDAGSAYVLHKDANGDWSQVQKIVASDRSANGRFGDYVAIDGDFIAVGSLFNVYVFRNVAGQWNEVQKLVPNPSNANRFYGGVDISGDYLVTLGRYDAGSIQFGQHAGAGYVFQKNASGTSWTEVQRILPADGHFLFGPNVSISGNTIAVGARETGIPPFGSAFDVNGNVYVYQQNTDNTWPQFETQKLAASDGSGFDKFGFDVDVDNNFMVVSTRYDAENATGGDPITYAGSAYIFERVSGTWVERQKIVAADREQFDGFGHTASISGNHVIVGAILEDHNATGQVERPSAGSAYIFEKDGNGNWFQQQKIVASDRRNSDNFSVVAISGNDVIVGAPAKSQGNNSNAPSYLSGAGAVYLFEFDPCSNQAKMLNDRITELENELLQLKEQLAQEIELFYDDVLKVIPNPSASGKFMVELTRDAPSEQSKIEIFDSNGRLIEVRSNLARTSQFDMHSLSKGVYILKFTNQNEIIVKKLIYR